jgi:hypothetical protein
MASNSHSSKVKLIRRWLNGYRVFSEEFLHIEQEEQFREDAEYDESADANGTRIVNNKLLPYTRLIGGSISCN